MIGPNVNGVNRKALRDLQAAMERTEKRDNYAKEFEKCIAEEERRLVGLVEAGIRERFVLEPLNIPSFSLSYIAKEIPSPAPALHLQFLACLQLTDIYNFKGIWV